MNKLLFPLITILVSVSAQQLPPPTDLAAVARSNAVGITWSPVEGAEKYVATIVSNDMTVDTSETRAAFGGLEPMTTYTASVVAVGVNDSYGVPAFIDFETLAAKPTNLQNVYEETTENMLVISWDQVNGTIDHLVEITTTDGGPVDSASISVVDNKAYINGLEKYTFYGLTVRAITDGGQMGDQEEFSARTAGKGLKVTAWWVGATTFGGEATIYRDFIIPPGEFHVVVQLTCPVAEIVVWNANLDMDNSDTSTGMYRIVQDELWMRERPEINFNFNRGNLTDECDLQVGNITVNFNPPPVAVVADTPQDTPLDITTSSWGVGGMVQINMGVTYINPANPDAGDMGGTLIAKPASGTFVIVVDSGSACPEGITVTSKWGLTTPVSLQPDPSTPNILYFVQLGNQWFSNSAGFVYTRNCLDVSGISVSVSENPSLVALAFN
uniref:Uncharacterized LOC100184933 n=1 Tax=Ciona intestinalis TaxID=7719 RepID=F6YAX2_CIOIN|nr:uncharacterized protein LOC100184933 [Ciona intestinalis]|eukprot:XP_002126365.2 uncharacterized protein LOC100184933 [Ciona intestinalis]